VLKRATPFCLDTKEAKDQGKGNASPLRALLPGPQPFAGAGAFFFFFFSFLSLRGTKQSLAIQGEENGVELA